MRSILATDVSASGSKVRVSKQDLNGKFLGGQFTQKDAIIQISEQVLREKLSALPSFNMVGVDYLVTPRGPTVLAFIDNYRALEAKEISDLEQVIQQRIADSNIQGADSIILVISSIKSSLSDRKGPLLPVWSAYVDESPEKQKKMQRIEALIKIQLQSLPDIFPLHFYFDIRGAEWKVLVETVGARILTPDEVRKIQAYLTKKEQQPVNVRAWSRIDSMVTPEGYGSMADYQDKRIKEWERFLLNELSENAVLKKQNGQQSKLNTD